MKIISVLLLCSLIAFTISATVTCNPGYNNGVSNAQQCLYATVGTPGNVCCMIHYLDRDSNYYKVCAEFNANMIVYFKNYDATLKNLIESYYPLSPRVDSLIDFQCTSNYLKISLFALLLFLF